MSLREYHKKRIFHKTPEPKGTHQETTGPLTFVIQKHAASRLHYDFRLELSGVLKSWAIPKGPSLNPDEKRLAIMVEDHPIDYAQFEGIIPKGNYGAGTVMVWDKGVYTPIAFVDRKKAEVLLQEQLTKGHLTFIMLGEKLRGEFALVKTHRGEENAWLLIKANDEYASKNDILRKDHSVLTERSMEQIAKQAEKKNEVWFSKPQKRIVIDAPKTAMPHHIKPMLAESSDEPFNDKDWLFEMKYDGYRAIAEIAKGDVKFYSRNNISYEEKFAPLVKSLKKFPDDAILDGEVCIVDTEGRPHFQWLQDYPKEKHGDLVYFVFDMLYYDGHDLTSLPLYRRKALLKQLLPPLPHIVYSEHIEEKGIDMFRHIHKLGIEGIMAKDKYSTYHEGQRTHDWLKIKTQKSEEVIIGGFTKPKGGRKYFGSLLAGMYKQGKLTFVGHVGGGFDEKTLETIYKKIEPLIQKTCPFSTTPETNAEAIWIKPKLIAEVTFSNWTNEGQMRHPIFLGLREDKDLKDLQEERYFATDPKQKDSEEVMVGKQTVTLTNLSKVFWPKEGYTKGDMIHYYREIAPVILPHLKDRPESLLRYPNGINEKSFYQKDTNRLNEDWIEKTRVYSESTEKNIQYILCQDEATLIYLINLGCIDLNPWSSRVGHIDNPDYLTIDLDPEETDFTNVVTVAQTTKDILEKFDIPSYCKTSGAKGMHIYIPLGAKYTYEQSRKLAELLCIHVHNAIPKITSLKRNPTDRKGLVYLDYLQNIKGQTLASAYSVRAKPGATVSTPLLWSEVTKKLHPSQFTIKNIPQRIQKHGDLFKGVLGKGIDMEKVLKKMSV